MRLYWRLLAAWPRFLTAEEGAERRQWGAAPDDVRGAYRALRNTPAFAAAVPRLFPGEQADLQREDGWYGNFTSSAFDWARMDLNDNGLLEVVLVLSAPGQACPEDGCPGFVMVQDGTSDGWRIACEINNPGWSRPVRRRRRSVGWHWFETGAGLIGWRRGAPGRGWRSGPVCYRAGHPRPSRTERQYLRGLTDSSELHTFSETDSPYAAALHGLWPEDIGQPRGAEDWRRRFDPLLHLRSLWGDLEPVRPGAVALMLASPLLCRDGRCPVAMVSGATNAAPRTTLCFFDVPWDADVTRLPERDIGIRRLAIGDRLVGWREAPDNPRGIACTVTDLPAPG
ncbi:hypothetical protein KPL78_14105 [Roseomonas sp. HJA6]|uniref:DUF1963 domain-containing protein n=1 Tax=Roseomonas alba TaxID=2846776 RepID=A0ABS7A9K9_9PROT|nr:hypothetical protein [Neoroseomonas alba]MBW6398994.1 hypothetical protein [Neoroseomonas alba]